MNDHAAGQSGPLTGLRVIDCSWGTAGPRATGMLADYGADVIRVEPPGGDPYRDELAVAYSVFNRGKRSIVLDLRSERDHDVLLQLIGSADVFVQSWRPGVAGRLGLGYDTIRRLSPSVIYCSISGFGADGPLRALPGYESVVHAVVGTMGEQVGHRDGPIFEGLPFASAGTAYLALIGILAALYRQADDGTGHHIETSLLDGALAFLSMVWGDVDGAAARLTTGANRLIARSYLCAGDEYIGVHTGAVGAFGRLMKALGLDDCVSSSEDGLDMGVPLTAAERVILDGEIHDIFASRPRREWEQRLTEADVCAIPLLHPGEVFDAPQAAHNGMAVEVEDPVLGAVQQVAGPLRFSAVGHRAQPSAAPASGQHTAEILAELRQSPPRAAARGSAAQPAAGDGRPLLDGLKVLDMGAFYAGPYSSRLLADLGADVIKLEPVAGDPMRGLERVFRSANAGKRSIAANVKDPAAGAVLRCLIEWADVVHHNMRPGAAERLGVGYEQVASVNPGAIYAYAPGWGATGPYAGRQSFAPLLSGYVGAGFEVAGQFNAPLWPVGNEDPGNGLLGTIGMLMALVYRQRHGAGQLVENPQLNAGMALMAHVVRRADGTVLGAGRLDPPQTGVSALERLYETADGWLLLAVGKEQEFDALGKALGTDLKSDPRFATHGARRDNDYELAQAISSVLATGSTATWLATLQNAGVAAVEPAAYNNVNFMRDPANAATGRVAARPGPDGRTVRELALLLRVSDTPAVPHRLAPGRGEDTGQLLIWAGYSTEEIAELRSRHVIG
jgi:crotonobetainyl-CoA:carnitine CoA-transferase CaiB-like acyl-CoA transferase